MNKQVEKQINVLKNFIGYNYKNGNLGLFLNGFAQRFLALQQIKSGMNENTAEEYKWLEFLFKNMGLKPVLNKKGVITYENIEVKKEEQKKENNFFNKKKEFKGGMPGQPILSDKLNNKALQMKLNELAYMLHLLNIL